MIPVYLYVNGSVLNFPNVEIFRPVNCHFFSDDNTTASPASSCRPLMPTNKATLVARLLHYYFCGTAIFQS